MSSAVVDERSDLANHFLTVASLKVLHRRRLRSHAVEPLGKRWIFVERCYDALQPLKPFEMNSPGVVPQERFVVEQMNRHGCKDTPDELLRFPIFQLSDMMAPQILPGVEAMRATRWVFGVSLFSTMCMASGHQTAANLVYVHAAVTTNDGSERPITGIRRESFKVLENNKEQQVAYLSDDTSFSAGIVLDGSRAWKDLVKTVVPSVLVKNQRSGDEIFFSDSGDSPSEGLYQAANKLIRDAHNPMQFLILFTDRNDPASYSYSKLRNLMKEKEFGLYIVTAPPVVRTNQISTPDMTALQELTALSGGKVFSLTAPDGLERLSEKIATDWRHQYRIGYEPGNSVADGKWRNIRIVVELRDPATNKVTKTKVRAKSGYYAPSVAAVAPGTK